MNECAFYLFIIPQSPKKNKWGGSYEGYAMITMPEPPLPATGPEML